DCQRRSNGVPADHHLKAQEPDETKPDLCKQCQMTIAELRRQALALSDPASFK
ncbi:hypothetical protein M9458_035067, partial [Cirrhinus mrigala]